MVKYKQKNKKQRRSQQAERTQVDPSIEIEELERRIKDEAPAVGYVPPKDSSTAFSAVPLSTATQRALVENGFTIMTEIQNACIPHALVGRDILGAAKTGSGKTLAFLIPLVECLYRQQFTPDDGPGAVVLSPTRELAMQIFSVLRQVGKHHVFSVGLLIGGKKDFYQEQQQITRTNIIIATPGRLLQHLEQTPYLDMNQLQMLILDEADRVLDMGFRNQLVRILDYLPQERQTLLFSATQTKDVKSLATLSLTEPQYLGVNETPAAISTPDGLQQSYVVVPLAHKLNAVYSFCKSHLQSKSICFFSTCAQVRHANDLFCSLRPGLVVLALHGKLSQERRTHIYFSFCAREDGALLLCTDMCARGLDFPSVDWVLQADAPEDRATYIHRVGRTARYRNQGNALLLVTPAEDTTGYVDEVLQQKQRSSFQLQRLAINASRATIVTDRAASLVASNTRLQSLARKAFSSYVRSLYMLPGRGPPPNLDVDGYAQSLGLAATPRLRSLQDLRRSDLRERKNVNHKLQRLKDQIKAEKLARKLQRMGGEAATIPTNNEESESEDDLLVVKKGETLSHPDDEEEVPRASMTDLHSLKSRQETTNKRIVFDEDGNEAGGIDSPKKDVSLEGEPTADSNAYIDAVRARLEQAKEQDEADHKERVRQKHKKRRLETKQEHEEPAVATLGDTSESSDDEDGSSSSDSSSSDSSSSSDDESEVDIKAQEELALRLIRG